MDDYDLAAKRLLFQLVKERVTALTQEATAEMAHIKAGSRVPGRIGTFRLGAVTVPESNPSASVKYPDVFAAWVAREWPGEMRDVIRAEYVTDPRVIALVKEHLPGAVEQQVRPGFRDEVLADVAKQGGWPDRKGEVKPVPGVERDPGGEALTPMAVLDKDVKAMAKNPHEPLPVPVAREIGIGMLALPAGGDGNA